MIFYSEMDEIMFLEWMNRISAIRKIEGLGASIFIYFRSNKISMKSLKELIGLFYRYDIDMKQLQIFLSRDNKAWFNSQTAYWYKKIFSL
jgi:hypothetical protein